MFTAREANEKTLYRFFDKGYLINVTTFPFSREVDAVFISKQGKWGRKGLKEFYLKLIECAAHYGFCPAFSETYYIIGNTLYRHRCNGNELCITQTGNTVFGDWWSMDIESRHPSKNSVRLTENNYRRELMRAKKRLAKESIDRAKKIHFSYPRISFVKHEALVSKEPA
jgi:hypothetical protein